MFKTRGEILLIVLACVLMINTLCSRKIYPEHSFINLTRTDEKKLENFMNGGIEKDLVTYNISPGEIIHSAKKYIGVPHCMGGASERCMDCSGLLMKVFSEHGIALPHNSQEQARFGQIISRMEELKKGDLVFFIRSYRTHRFITHSGIYTGNHEFIHTSSSKGVTISSLDNPWWNEKFIFGTRIF